MRTFTLLSAIMALIGACFFLPVGIWMNHTERSGPEFAVGGTSLLLFSAVYYWQHVRLKRRAA
jgi:uncharacterized membrane protein YiaA